MVNKPGRIGREGEHTATKHMVEAGFHPDTEREGRRAPSLDIVGPDLRIPIEVRRRKNINLKGWVRELVARHDMTWALFVIERDKRRKEAIPDLLVLPAPLGARALKVLHERGEL